jgi:hypothetical protein
MFIRPIPKQIWPTKYEDLGMGWMTDEPGSAGFNLKEWEETAGFPVQMGSATGFVADLFLEFSFFFVVPCFLIGRFHSWAWQKSTALGGSWALLHCLMLILSVFLVAQSVGAWLYKLLLLWVPCWYIHRYIMASGFRSPPSPTFPIQLLG